MATDDPKNPDDLLSRRMSSGTDAESSAEPSDGTSDTGSHSHNGHYTGEHIAEDATFTIDDSPSGTGPAGDSDTGSAGAAPEAGTAEQAPLSEETVEFDPIGHRNKELRDRAFADSSPEDPDATVALPPIRSAEPATASGADAAPEAVGTSGTAATTSGAATTATAVAPTQQISAHEKDDSRSRDVDMPTERRTTALDVIGTIWIALTTPFVLTGLGVRLIASGLFLKFEYFWRPGFPADTYGFTNDDRLHYSSYVVDYLNNFDSSRYLSDVVLPNGVPLFQPEEIAHMEDVKDLVSLLYLVAVIGAIGGIVFGLYMSRANGPGLRYALRFGSLATIIAFLGLGVFAMLGWDRFFTQFHAMFFDAGTWEFYVDDALIRLFPGQFWVDAGIAVALIVLLVSLLMLSLSFMGRRRAERKAAASA